MPHVYTEDEIVAIARVFRAPKAVVGGRIIDDHCLSPMIEAVQVGGKVVALRKIVEGGVEKHGAGMIRVSGLIQTLGFSLDDQIRNAIKFFVEAGIAFRIYSDADASGSLPWQDTRLIGEMIEAKIKRYRRVFRRVLLNPYRVATYTPEQLASVEGYLAAYIERQRKSIPADVLDLRPYHKQVLTFRPALTRLVEHLPNICIIVVNDLSRLSRNAYLFAEIVRKFQAHNIRVVGSMESLEFLNTGDDDNDQDDFGNELQAWFLSKMAEYRLREVLMGSLRGLLESLEQGVPRGRLASWIERVPGTEDAPGVDPATGLKTRCKPGAEQAVLRLIELFADEGVTPGALEGRLKREGVPCPAEHGNWTYDLIKGVLTSRALLGYECDFGLEFPIFPRLVDEQRWQQIQTHWVNRDKTNDFWQYRREPGVEHKSEYLATGLMVCHCRGSLSKKRGGSIGFKPAADPSKKSYVCGNARRKPGLVHITLHAQNVWDFIDGLMASDPRVFLPQAATEDYSALQEQAQRAERAVLDTQTQLDMRKSEMRPQVEAGLVALGARPTSPTWKQRVDDMLADRMADDPLALALAQREAERASAQQALADYAPPEAIASLAERIIHWRELKNWEKNEVLLATFEAWYFQRRNNSDLEIELLMVRRDGKALPPVPLICALAESKVKGKRDRIWRRLPDPADWIASIIHARHSRIGEQK